MENIYSLLDDNKKINDEFYENLNKSALEMINYFQEKDSIFIEDFIKYIRDEEKEKLCSFNEYAILKMQMLLKIKFYCLFNIIIIRGKKI